jgi:hypothetical protein
MVALPPLQMFTGPGVVICATGKDVATIVMLFDATGLLLTQVNDDDISQNTTSPAFKPAFW